MLEKLQVLREITMSLCIVAVILLSGVLTEFADARRLSRTHQPHHRRWNEYDLEELVPRVLSLRHSAESNRYWEPLDPPRQTDETRTNIEDLVRVSRPRRHHLKNSIDRNVSKGATTTTKQRQNDKKANGMRVDTLHEPVDENGKLELEERLAQNASICNYTVEPITDENGVAILKHLNHIKCNHVNSWCHADWHSCIQTFRMVKLECDDCGSDNTIKIYTGCVCGLLPDSELGHVDQQNLNQ